MLETIGKLLGDVALYIAALLGLVALYFLWVALREWRASARAAFGIERDIAISEMTGAIARAGVVVVVGVIVLGLGQLGRQIEESAEDTPAQPTRTPLSTVSAVGTGTPGLDQPVSTPVATNTLLPPLTEIPPLPVEPTDAPALEPTPHTASVTAFGGVWLRDAPNGGTIGILPQQSVVEFLEGRQPAGDFIWQQVKVLNTPPAGQELIGLDGWVASEFLEVNP